MLHGKISKQESGFTLIETLIALAVFTIAVVYLVTVFPFGINSASSAQHKTVATNLAQAKIEEIISSAYAAASLGQVLESSLNSIDPDFSQYSRLTSVSYVDGNLQATGQDLGLKKVQVTVSWKDHLAQASSSLSLFTLIADY